ncbi:MAG: glycosyltransferase [Phycisphaerales bacterium]
MTDALHLGFVYDDEALTAEAPTINRLGVGLLAEGHRVMRVVSPAGSATIDRLSLATRIEMPMSTPPWLRRARAADALAAMKSAIPDLFIVRGNGAWTAAADLALAAERPLLADVWRPADVGRVARLVRRGRFAGAIAPAASIAAALQRELGAARVRAVPLGVGVPATARPVLARPDDAITIAVVGSGDDLAAWRSVLSGLSMLCREMPQIELFVELGGSIAHAIWREARRLDLLGQMTAIEEISEVRRLLTRCDMMVLPEPLSEARSIILEAMAIGMPVVGVEDPLHPFLRDGETADVLATPLPPEPEAWSAVLGRRLSDAAEARALGLHGRHEIEVSHRSSHRIERLADAAAHLIGRDTPAPS